jgi:DNA (cytosine-5)-methyltransferase 3A
MNVLSLFDGMSCGRIALERLGIKVDNYYAAEIKPHAIEVTKHNYPDTKHLGDVRTVLDKIPDLSKIDLVIGGSPCQDFSQANRVRDGLQGEKSGLFYEFLKIVNAVREANPNMYFLLENVRMKKEHQDVISLLMVVEPINVNSKVLTAQLRNRFYWTNIPDFKFPEDKNVALSTILTSGWTDRLKSRALLESDSRPLTTPVKMFHRYYSTGFTTLIFESEEHYKACKKHYEENHKGKKGVEITESDPVYDGVRYLNKTELERLQTVPEGYTAPLKRDDAACLLGDGWTVDVIVEFFKGLK